MARLHDRQDKLTITDWMRIAKNAVLNVVASDGSEHSLTANELATMTTSGRGTVLAAAKTVTVAEAGKTFFLDLAGGFTVTLPAAAVGLKYKFVVATAPTTAYIIVTDSSANVINGSICSPEVAALVSVVAAADTISFIANLALPGDYCELESDGTNWYLSGMTFVQDGMTSTQAS